MICSYEFAQTGLSAGVLSRFCLPCRRDVCNKCILPGSIRHQFSTAENVEMSIYATDFLRKAADLLEVDGEKGNVAFHEG